MRFQFYLAWVLIPIVSIIFVKKVRQLRSRVARAIVCYVSFSIVFGCIHFLIYRYNPSLYQVKEVQAQSDAKGEKSIETDLNADLKKIAVLNVILLHVGSDVHKPLPPLQIGEASRSYPNRYEKLSVTTHMHVQMVGPNRDEPVYGAQVTFLFTADDRGLSKGTEAGYTVDVPNDPSITMEDAELISALSVVRSNLIDHMNDLFRPGNYRSINFSILDFLYFSFSIIGVGEVIPASQAIRFLVYLQMICIFVIPLAVEGSKQQHVHMPPTNPSQVPPPPDASIPLAKPPGS